MKSLLNADVKVVIQKTEGQLQKTIFTFDKILQNYGLEISATRSKTMAVEGKHVIRLKVVVEIKF